MPYDQSSGHHGKRRLSTKKKNLTLAELTQGVPENLARALNFGDPSSQAPARHDMTAQLKDIFNPHGKSDPKPTTGGLDNLLDPTGILHKVKNRNAMQKVAQQTTIKPVAKQKQDDLA